METCARCNKEIVKPANSCGTGYGEFDGKKYCYPCCGEVEKQKLMNISGNEKYILYLSGDEVINWCGTLRIRPRRVKTGLHNIARTRTDVWFTVDGKRFHGTQYGDFSELLYIKSVK